MIGLYLVFIWCMLNAPISFLAIWREVNYPKQKLNNSIKFVYIVFPLCYVARWWYKSLTSLR